MSKLSFRRGPGMSVWKTRTEAGKRDQVEKMDTIIAVFPDHDVAEGAVKKLARAGFDMKRLTVVGNLGSTAAPRLRHS